MHRRTPFAPAVGVCLLVTGLVIVLGLGSPTLAQKETPAPKAEADRKGTSLPVAEVPPPNPPAIESVPVTVADPFDAPGIPAAPAAEPAKMDTLTVPAAQQGAAAATPAGDDPERAAQDFADRTRKEADAAIKSLTAEAETLRARLRKVEAGLQRWQALQTALDQNSRKVAVGDKKAWKQMEGREPASRPAPRTIEAVPTGDLPLPPDAPRPDLDRGRKRGEPVPRR
jgi:hypothetical protein